MFQSRLRLQNREHLNVATRACLSLACLSLICLSLVASSAAASSEHATWRTWIGAMKKSPKGPFQKIRWFCKDGSVLPPKAYACSRHGGGIQHGLWSQHTQTLRKRGFRIGNVLAALDKRHFIGPKADLSGLKQILLERFLITADDGWIFRGARSYRGAFQSEDEEAASERLSLAMVSDTRWLAPARFMLLREAVRLLPGKNRSPAAAEVRSLSTAIHRKDPKFASIRARIHAFPSAGDAKRVRDYARTRGIKALRSDYARLATVIDQVFRSRALDGTLRSVARRLKRPELKRWLEAGNVELGTLQEPETRFARVSQLLSETRDALPKARRASGRLALLRASLALEREAFQLSGTLVSRLPDIARQKQLRWLKYLAHAMYGTGFINHHHVASMEESVDRLLANPDNTVHDYRKELRYLARAVGWSERTLAFHFRETQNHLKILEPLVDLYHQDRLRGSPLLFFSAMIDNLVLDANRLAGMAHHLFGQSVGSGVRALNPGLARGTLKVVENSDGVDDPHAIYLLPGTTSDLPPVAGILTQKEGNPLSHVQLLARNLAIPNAVIGAQWLSTVAKQAGSRVVMSVRSDGVVTLAEDAPHWDRFFEQAKRAEPTQKRIRPNLEKLNLEEQEFVSLATLRADDSGRLVGPKGANLGELTHLFGDAVPAGFVIPFGVFRTFLEQPIKPGGPSVFSWMETAYADIAKLPEGSQERRDKAHRMLARLRHWITTHDPGKPFRQRLKAALRAHFGKDGSFGVFVRSDTNIEDLPGFTGAGLNHTVPNVVGRTRILKAIQTVWASPFTERAYAWRQAHMETPQYVFPAVLVQYSFPSEKSGVMVTHDVVWGEEGWLSIAVNEGVGGAVDGQAAESLRVHAATGEVRLLAHATAPFRKELAYPTGVKRVPAHGFERLLTKAEIQQLITLANDIPQKFPSLRDEGGNPMPADVEFAFKGGRLALLQIRPFVHTDVAGRIEFMAHAKSVQPTRETARVSLQEVPNGQVATTKNTPIVAVEDTPVVTEQ